MVFKGSSLSHTFIGMEVVWPSIIGTAIHLYLLLSLPYVLCIALPPIKTQPNEEQQTTVVNTSEEPVVNKTDNEHVSEAFLTEQDAVNSSLPSSPS